MGIVKCRTVAVAGSDSTVEGKGSEVGVAPSKGGSGGQQFATKSLVTDKPSCTEKEPRRICLTTLLIGAQLVEQPVTLPLSIR